MGYVTPMHESRHTHERVMPHTHTNRLHIKSPDKFVQRVMSHPSMSHVTLEWVMSHTWMSHVTLTNESCYTNTYKQAAHPKTQLLHAMSHVTPMSECYHESCHVTLMSESCHTHTSCDPNTLKNESCHTHTYHESCHTHTYQQAAHKMRRHPHAISHVTPTNE